MKSINNSVRVRTAIAAAVQGALLSLAPARPAPAAEPASGAEAVAQLTQPSGELEVGAGDVTKGSYKFGEYNGLEHEGLFPILNFDLSGGGSYDSDSVRRWDVRGADLGVAARELSLDYREQGKFRIDLGFDQLRHNISDSYQTPYLGTGSNTLHLPLNWLKPSVPQANATNLNDRALSPVTGLASAVTPAGAVVPPTAAQRAQVIAILGADVPDFQRYNLYTQRLRWGGGFGVDLSRHWQFTANMRQERRYGTQPLGAISSAIQENSVILPEPIDTETDQYEAGFHYAADKGFLDVGYYGSMFLNRVKAITWDDPADRTRTATMSSAPSNQFHQVNLAGGYSVSPNTRLSVSGSYGRSTQNDPFLSDTSLPLGLPETSADALVVSRNLDVKLSARPTRAVRLLAAYKYDDHDNRTNVARFVFYDVNLAKGAAASSFNGALGLPAGTLSSNVNIFNNRPHSRRLNQLDLNADYAPTRAQSFALGYQWQGIKRHCHNTWIDCENADTSNESTFRAEWRARFLDTLETRIAYAFANRTVAYNSNAWLALVPMANVVPGAPTAGATTSVYGYLTQTGLTGFGPLAGFPASPLTGAAALFSPNNNIVPQSLYGSRDNDSELPGLRRFNVADRRRNKLRSSLDWQASERLALQGGFEYNRDEYEHSTYGLLQARGWALSLEGDYRLNDDFELPVFYTHEDQRSRSAGDGFGTNTNAAFVGRAGNTLVSGGCYATVLAKNLNGKMDPCLIWSTDMRERADTLGLTLARKGLKGGRLDLAGDLVYTWARTDIGVSGGSYANNPFALAGAPVLAPGVPAVFFIPATDLPTVATRTLQVRLRAQYAVGRSSQVNLLAAYERLRSSDFAYDGMQFGSGTEQLPTNERPFSYSLAVFGISFIHRLW
ncbi:MAG: MtrB/PioB family decaheme-associated outer membrane protein [Gammaproteobacteria bacterium]|nr:MAG: MtrB/PioB family decaheme-associated outer membrane protein [Gammaproteobacteria bacterium]